MPWKRLDFSGALFFVTCGVLIFVYGVIVEKYEIFAYEALKFVQDSTASVYNERETLAEIKPVHFLQPARYDGAGVTVNAVAHDQKDDLVLLSGFFGDSNELRLIRRDGGIVARWPVRFSEIFQIPAICRCHRRRLECRHPRRAHFAGWICRLQFRI